MSRETSRRKKDNSLDEVFCRAYEHILNEELPRSLVTILKRLRQEDCLMRRGHTGGRD